MLSMCAHPCHIAVRAAGTCVANFICRHSVSKTLGSMELRFRFNEIIRAGSEIAISSDTQTLINFKHAPFLLIEISLACACVLGTRYRSQHSVSICFDYVLLECNHQRSDISTRSSSLVIFQSEIKFLAFVM